MALRSSSLQHKRVPSEEMNSNVDDDGDEDLQALRAAALLSLKSKKNESTPLKSETYTRASLPSWRGNRLDYHHLRGNYQRRDNNTVPKWRQQSNLIVINTVPLDQPSNENNAKSVPPLVLPQDKWSTVAKQNQQIQQDPPKGPKKFSRIRSNSDESDIDDEGSDDGSMENMGDLSPQRRSEVLSPDQSASLSDDGEDIDDLPDPLNELELDFAEDEKLENLVEESNEETKILEPEKNGASINDNASDEEDSISSEDETSNSLKDRNSVSLQDENSNESGGLSQKSVEEDESLDHFENTASLDENEGSLSDSDQESAAGSVASLELRNSQEDDIDIDLNSHDLSSKSSSEAFSSKAMAERSSWGLRKHSRGVRKSSVSQRQPVNKRASRTPICLDFSEKRRKRESKVDQLNSSKESNKKSTDLRNLLRAKRKDHSSSRTSELDTTNHKRVRKDDSYDGKVRSVLSVVKPLARLNCPQEQNDKERRSRIDESSRSRNVSLKGRLKSSSVQVTVVTDNKVEVEKKSSVHLRLGPIPKPNSNQRSLSRTTTQLVTHDLSETLNKTRSNVSSSSNESHDTFADKFHASNSSKQREKGHREKKIIEFSSNHKTKSNSKKSQRSGFSNVKETELDAKICRIQAYNAAILKRKEEIEADKKRHGK